MVSIPSRWSGGSIGIVRYSGNYGFYVTSMKQENTLASIPSKNNVNTIRHRTLKHMKYIPVTIPHYACALCLCVVLGLMIIACGCTQQQSASAQNTSGVTVTKPDDTHITVAFTGAPGMDSLLELEMTVTDSNGKSVTMSKGSRLATTPVQIHATQTFTGSYSGKNHVFITGYFANGTHSVVVDQDI